MQNHISCHAVADYFLLQVDFPADDSISHLKLQKLCYYAQAWHLALHGKPLFGERIEAWAHGPVVPELYKRFKANGWQTIDPQSLRSDPMGEIASEDRTFLDQVWERYGGRMGRQLENMTHAEAPWKDTYGDRETGEKCQDEITQKAMREFYTAKLVTA